MESPATYGPDESSHHSTYFTPQQIDQSNVTQSSRGSKDDDENICFDSKFDVTGSTALAEEVCTKSRVCEDVVPCSVNGNCEQTDENQTPAKEFCCCPYSVVRRMSEPETEYLDFNRTTCNDFDENCFCHESDDMSSSISTHKPRKNVVTRNYSTKRRMIKIRIKTSSSKECSVDGESTENGIKICISPRERDIRKKNENNNHEYALNETYSITSSRRISTTTTASEVESSVETDYEFRKNLKNELKRSPAAVKVLNYLESLSEARKKSPEHVSNKRKSENNRKSDRQRRSKTPTNRAPTPQSIKSAEDEEFHDCRTIFSETDATSDYEDTTDSFETSQGDEKPVKKDAPLITITQEMSAQMVVTSKFEINKEKLKRMNEKRESRERRQSKESRGSPDKIIDDNFCNEILDKMNQLGLEQRNFSKKQDSSPESQRQSNDDDDTECDEKLPFDTTLETSTTSTHSLGPQKPPRTFAYRRSQDNAEKVPKLPRELRMSLESLDMYLYEEMKQLKLFKFNQSRKSVNKPPQMQVTENNYVVAGWKVSSPQSAKITEVPPQSPPKIVKNNEIGWKTPVNSPKKVSPGWIHSQQPAIPEEIVNMLHYSDDEAKKQRILSSNSRAEPQRQHPKYPCNSPKQQLGPKLDIDTVDAITVHTPSSSSNQRFEDFANNPRARSTPRRKEPPSPAKNPSPKRKSDGGFAKKLEPYFKFKRTKEICKKFLEMERGTSSNATTAEAKSSNPLPSVEAFLENERRANEICKKCCREVNPKEQKFHQKAFSRTKSLFVASKRKINAFGHHAKSTKPKIEEVLSDSDPYCTPERGNTPQKPPETRHSWHASQFPVVPKHRNDTKTFNYNAPLPQSPQRPLLDVTPPRNSPLHMKIKLSPKRLFGMNRSDAATSTPASPIVPRQGDYKSFEDQEQNLAATMGEILSQLRNIIEGDKNSEKENVEKTKHTDVVDGAVALKQQNSQTTATTEPDYAEISQQMQIQVHANPETHQRITKKSPPTYRIERNNNEYIVVTHDPNAIYATVVKKDVSKSMSHLQTRTANAGTANSSSASSTPCKPVRTKNSRRRITFQATASNTGAFPKNASNAAGTCSSALEKHQKSNSCSSLHSMADKNISKNLFGSDQCLRRERFPRNYRLVHEKYQKRSAKYEQEIKEIAYDTNIMDQYLDSLNKILNKKLIVDDKNIKKATEDFLSKEIDVDNHQRAADETICAEKDVDKTCNVDADHLSTGGTYKSFGFPRPDAKRATSDDLHEQSFSLNYSSGDVDSHNNEAGYDTVDFQRYKDQFLQTNAVDEIICDEAEFDQYFNSDEKERQVTSLDDTLTTESTAPSASSGSTGQISSVNASPAKAPNRRDSLYSSFKKSLRTSFRRGRDFIKQEQDKLVHLFDKNAVIDGKNAVPKPARSFVNLDEYKKYYNDQNAEQIYRNWSEKLQESDSTDPHEKRMLELINTISSQRQIKKQLRHALEICRVSKEFDCSSELVEAERLLLVSNLKEAAAKKELMEMENNVYANVKQTGSNNIGMIALSDFEFPLKDAAMYDTLYNYFYICVATYKDQVKASYAKEREGNKVSFRGFDIKFWEVEPDYQIKIEVFVLCLRKNNRGAENRLNSTKSTIKMSPRRFFGVEKSSEKSSPQKKQTEFLEFSQFASQGFLFITSSSFVSYSESLIRRQIPDANIDLPYYSSSNFHQYLKKSGDHHINCIEDYRSFRMNQMIYNSHMTGQIEMAIKSEVVFDGSQIQGFLTVGESINGTITWNRRWCKVDGLQLNFWNYPQEAADGKPPVEVLDITKCENDVIYQADRAICPRPRAIVIEQADSSTTTDARPGYYFLVTDNKQELKDWLRELNKILRFVRDWKL
ncbi:uncharacterized protein LOC134831486 [Culicoides brevitarsis]|uniref:uncharacterized protein LOC134831486 n=1 Tax=Culicoides brevitarsis TaxID=469753 RepID=UPI00307B3F7E